MSQTARDYVYDCNELYSAYRSNDSGKVNNIISEITPKLVSRALRMVADHSLAEDIVQDTWVRVFRNKFESFEPEKPLLPWLSTIMHNIARDYMRAEMRRREIGFGENGEFHSYTPDHLKGEIKRENLQKVNTALGGIDPSMSKPLSMYYFDGMSYKEIASALGLPIGTVKSRISNTIQRVREELED